MCGVCVCVHVHVCVVSVVVVACGLGVIYAVTILSALSLIGTYCTYCVELTQSELSLVGTKST